ncbi:Uncharacterized protein ALO59_04382 [Pseudomonas amygdali pv. mellea]|uniref:DUF7740 domain-containing protein n=1 Tax=Pseudomonas amygdali TaxID=47877 RepID=UPI0006E64249|nr:hypothetical protein [Pseudomonas amygdali]KPW34097.1 Uncharacterized protein ALO51_00361 [Pseudomonas amygdali]KPX78307.1 Uncharacterized protein ALO59_04382 [Pseudomonas amygdali pv. mellea]
MNLTHASLVLLLAAKIHGTNAGVRAAAKNVLEQLPRSQRELIYLVIDSKQPLEMIRQIALNLDTPHGTPQP